MRLTAIETESTVAIKGGKVRATNMERLVLSLPDDAGMEIKVAFNELVAPESPLQQISAVEKLSDLSGMSDDNAKFCVSVLTSALLQLNPKVQLRNKIFKTLPTMGCNNPELYKATILKVIVAGLTDPKTSQSVVFGIPLLVEANGALLVPRSGREKKGGDEKKVVEKEEQARTDKVITPDLHPVVFGALLNGITQLWQDFLIASSAAEASTVLQHLQQLVKSSTMYVQQHFSNDAGDMPQELHSLKNAVFEVIQHPSCPLDLRTNCGQLVATITKTLHNGNLQQQETSVATEKAIHRWLEMILSFSLSENDTDTRQTTAQAVCDILPHLVSHPCITDKTRLVVYEVITTELQDDSDCVRDIVSYGVSGLLKHHHHGRQQFCLQPTRVMEKVCGLIASCTWPEASSLLVKLSLKEDLPEGFGLAQEDDRVFDKGEMNIYSEKIIVSQAMLKGLSDALTLNSFASASTLTFLKSHVVPFLCAATVRQDKIPEDVWQIINQKEDQLLSLNQLLSLLEYDIFYIYEQIMSLKDTALFCVRHVDLWLMRLSCRSAIWARFSPLIDRESSLVKSVVEGLNQSVLKNSFLCQIIEELSSVR